MLFLSIEEINNMKVPLLVFRHFLIFFAFIPFLFSQSRIDNVHLKNGNILRGKIIENIPNEFIKIELFNGQIQSSEYSEIVKITAEIDLTESNDFVGNGSIIIRTNPPNAIVIAGGMNFGKSPVLIADLPSGELPIIVKKDGNLSKNETVIINGISQQKITIALEKKTGSALFDSDPENVEIYINGKLIGHTPFSISGLDLGRYKVIYQKEGYFNIEGYIDIKYSSNSIYTKNLTFIDDLVSQQKKYTRKSFLMYGASTIAILAGGYAYMQSNKEYKSYENASSTKMAKEKRDLVEQFDSAIPIAVGGSALLAIPATYFLIKSINTKKLIEVGQSK